MLPFLLACSPSTPPAPTYQHPVHRASIADGTSSQASGGQGPRVYYDAVHGARHLHDRDNRRYRTDYHTISGWFRFVEMLREVGYQVHAEDYASFDRASLDDYDVFIVGEQTYHARFMTDAERRDLIDWVRDGGGLFVTAEHTNAHYMTDVFNLLAEPLPVRARMDSICDTETSDRSSRDWVKLTPAGDHPVTEGVDAYWFYNGCSLDTEHGVLMSSESAWSDAYQPDKKPVHNGDKRKAKDEITGSLAGIAAFEYGKGRVVVIGDHNGLSNTELYVADHHRFGLNAIRWLAGKEDDPSLIADPYDDGYDILIHSPEHAGFHVHRKSDRDTYRLLMSQWGKEPQHRAWAHPELVAGHEMLMLGAPKKPYTAQELAILDGYLAEGKPVLWLASTASLKSPASKQLQEHVGITIQVDDKATQGRRMPLEVMGDPAWTAGVLRLFVDRGIPQVRVEGAEPVVSLRQGFFHVEDGGGGETLYDVVSKKDVGGGTFWVVAPLELFDDRALPDATRQDVVRQQAAELGIRMVKIPLGDETRYED